MTDSAWNPRLPRVYYRRVGEEKKRDTVGGAEFLRVVDGLAGGFSRRGLSAKAFTRVGKTLGGASGAL